MQRVALYNCALNDFRRRPLSRPHVKSVSFEYAVCGNAGGAKIIRSERRAYTKNMLIFLVYDRAENVPRERSTPMTAREEKQLQRISQKLETMKTKQKEILSRERKRQRNARTRRLTQIGGLAEKYFNCEGMPTHEFEKVLKEIANKLLSNTSQQS